MPAFRGTFRVSIIEVDGYGVVRGCIGVAKGEKEYAPERFTPGVSSAQSAADGTDQL